MINTVRVGKNYYLDALDGFVQIDYLLDRNGVK